jgi:hypothetical protein
VNLLQPCPSLGRRLIVCGLPPVEQQIERVSQPQRALPRLLAEFFPTALLIGGKRMPFLAEFALLVLKVVALVTLLQ